VSNIYEMTAPGKYSIVLWRKVDGFVEKRIPDPRSNKVKVKVISK
jgi:hypothetical protein